MRFSLLYCYVYSDAILPDLTKHKDPTNRVSLPPYLQLRSRLLCDVTFVSLNTEPSNRPEVMRALAGESSRLKEVWRELLSTGAALEKRLRLQIDRLDS